MSDNAFEDIARLYDWEHDPYQDDIEMYLALARRFGGPVLALACGSGRVLAPLAEAGLTCTGVDSAPSMLERARQRFEKHGLTAKLVESTVQSLSLPGETYRSILWPIDGLALLLTRVDQLSALRALRKLVTHDGRLVIDVSNGNLRGGQEPTEEVLHQLSAEDPETGKTVTKWVIRRPHVDRQLDDLRLMYDEVDDAGLVQRTTANLQLRWFTRNEVELLLELGGWQPDEVYGDYDLSDFDADSERIIIVARPLAAKRPSLEGTREYRLPQPMPPTGRRRMGDG